MDSNMRSTKFGQLAAMVVEPQAAIEQTVVLLHGYGAPGTDLVGLGSELRPAKATRFVFLQAPHTLPGMSGPFAGRAWWDIDMIQLQVIMMTQSFDLLAQSHPAGLDEATEILDHALSAIADAHGGHERLFVGGFSQGGMLACHWALTRAREIAGLILLSSTLICEREWRDSITRRPALQVFQSHSPDDQVLPFALAERLKQLLIETGQRHSWVQFRGGHGISPEVLTALSQFLS